MKQQNYRIRSIAISSALGLMLSACGTNPVQQVQNQQQDDYRAQAKVAKQAIREAPDWMSKLPKESGVIYENGTAISSDFSMADLKAKTMAYVKICTGAGGKVRSQMKMYRADNDEASVEQSELTVRSLCPDVDISGVETVEMKHVAEGNRIRTYVLVALPLGSKNVAKSAKEIQNRSGDAFKELDGITRDTKDTREQNTSAAPAAPVATPIAPNKVEQISKTPAPILSTPSAQAEPARVEQVMPPLSPASNRPFVAPATKPDGSLLESVKAIGNDAVISFSEKAKNSDVTLLFYSGHGIQLGGINYLLPTDIDFNSSQDVVTYDGLSLNDIRNRNLPGATKLIFLDACRTNPFKSSATRGAAEEGLAPVNVSTGTIISYATRDGGVAYDASSGNNSPYTQSLLKHLDDDEDVEIMLRSVRDNVVKLTQNKQEPWKYGSLSGGKVIISKLDR